MLFPVFLSFLAANVWDTDQDRQSIDSDLDPDYLTIW